MRTVSSEQMRALDKRTIEEAGITGYELMRRAGESAADFIIEYLESFEAAHVRRLVVLAGKGNNGGDAYAAAKYLYERSNIEVIIYAVCPANELGPDSRKHAKQIPDKIPLYVKRDLSPEDFRKGDIIIDGLLGIGAKGPLRPPLDKWIPFINSLELPLIALDIPSGLDADDGTASMESCIMADMTVTMGLPKTGLLKGAGSDFSGMLRCADIGIPRDFVYEKPKIYPELIMASDAAALFKRVPQNSHKGSRGRLLVIGGSSTYPGAPFLSAESALKSGAGMVFLALPQSVQELPWTNPAIILRKIKDNSETGTFSYKSLPEIKELLEICDAVVIGPGLSRNPAILPLLEFILKTDIPKVLDADALNIISDNPEIYVKCDKNIFTPHSGEMHRLLKGFGFEELLNKDPLEQAEGIAYKKNATFILKGHRSIIVSPEGDIRINSSGSPALATAGSGDVLSGITGAFIAQKHAPYEAASAAVFIHGLCGELSPLGIRGTTAADLPGLIPAAIKKLSPFA